MLRDLIKDKHNEAEEHRFVKMLFGGNLSKHAYTEFLYNQYIIYSALEKIAAEKNVFEGIENVIRSSRMAQDLFELDDNYSLKIMPSSIDYINYLVESKLSKQDLMAHIYVRHMGDLFGGQMIKKVIPGQGTVYDFDNRSELIKNIRERLNDDMADEANRVFEFAIQLFEDISIEHNIQ
jgi:heme oxygenase